MFPQSHVKYLPMIGSDHRLIVEYFRNGIYKPNRAFRFEKRWNGKEGLNEVIKNGWTGTYMDRNLDFVDRIHKCRATISYWKKYLQPYDRDRINRLKAELDEAKEDDQVTQV